MTDKQEQEGACAFHLLFGRRVKLRPDGQCPVCMHAPSDDEQVTSFQLGLEDDTDYY